VRRGENRPKTLVHDSYSLLIRCPDYMLIRNVFRYALSIPLPEAQQVVPRPPQVWPKELSRGFVLLILYHADAYHRYSISISNGQLCR
jgi:hypothetical protein